MNPLLKKKATSRQGIEDEINYIYTIADDPATPKEEAQQLLSRIPALQQELKSNGWDTPPSNEEFTSLQERGWLPDDESLRSGDAQIADMADDLRGTVTHEKTPNALDKRWMKSVGIQAKKSPLLQKKATIGQFGIDYHLREDMENSTPHTVGQPSAYAEKGTEDSTVAPNPLVASAHFACAQCKKAFVEPTDLATHAEESKHNVWDDDPIKEEVEDANFFKESEDEAPVDPNPDPFAKALKSLEELAITTTDDDVRECCKLAIEDLRYFREGHPPAQSDKVAATKSYGGTPAHPTPLGGTANPSAAPVPVAPTTPPPTPNTPAPAPKPNTPPPVVGQPLTQDQVNTLQQTAAVEMHPTPKDKPPSNFRGYMDEGLKNDIKKKVDAPVMHTKAPAPKQADAVPHFECPYCGGTPVYREDPVVGAPHVFYCHFCNKGFDAPKQKSAAVIGSQWDKLKSSELRSQYLKTAGINHPTNSLLSKSWRQLSSKQQKLVIDRLMEMTPKVSKELCREAFYRTAGDDEVPLGDGLPSMGMLESWMTSDKVVNLQAVGDELIPVSAQDLAMLKKLTGLTSFNESEYDTVLEKVGQHDYSLEVQYPDDDGEAPMSFNASVEQACPNCQKANVKVVDEEDEDKLMECNDCGSFFTV